MGSYEDTFREAAEALHACDFDSTGVEYTWMDIVKAMRLIEDEKSAAEEGAKK